MITKNELDELNQLCKEKQGKRKFSLEERTHDLTDEGLTRLVQDVIPEEREAICQDQRMSAIDQAVAALNARGVTHGDYKRNFEIAVGIFREWVGITLTPIQGNMFLQCLKMAREICNPEYFDNRPDQVGYIELRERMVHDYRKDKGGKVSLQK